MLPVRLDPPCRCGLIQRDHRRSDHGRIDWEAAYRSYLRHVPLEGHAATVERLYTVRRPEEATLAQKVREEGRS